jgi:hypothetical protein
MNIQNGFTDSSRYRNTRLAALGLLLSAWLTGCLSNFFPAQGCEPTLLLGTNQYHIQSLNPNSDGSLKIPGNQPGNAYWIKGTNTNYVFGLGPTDNNLSLESSLKTGDQATVTWDNCNSTKFSLTSPQAGVPDNATLLDQSVSGITIFVQPGPSVSGFVAKGELTKETITTFNTPDKAEIQAEVSLLETTTSSDGETIRVGISILNNGQAPITLSANNVSLTPDGATALMPDKSEPALPKEIKTGATEAFYFTFARPNTQIATIKVFSAEYELEGY